MYRERGGASGVRTLKRVLRLFEAKEVVFYAIVGVLQLIVDCSLFVFATAMGAHTGAANILGRVSGAALGYFGNSRITFASKDGTRAHGATTFARFAVVWLVLTAISSASVIFMDRNVSLHAAWFIKPILEIVLAGCGFLTGKFWVYKRREEEVEQ